MSCRPSSGSAPKQFPIDYLTQVANPYEHICTENTAVCYPHRQFLWLRKELTRVSRWSSLRIKRNRRFPHTAALYTQYKCLLLHAWLISGSLLQCLRNDIHHLHRMSHFWTTVLFYRRSKHKPRKLGELYPLPRQPISEGRFYNSTITLF
jgi:hypothetical protein